jgi:hypothetical protein
VFYVFKVKLPGMNLKAFLAVLEYLYTDQVSKDYQGSKVAAMAVANFFCLPRLVALYEKMIVDDMEKDMCNISNVVGMCPAGDLLIFGWENGISCTGKDSFFVPNPFGRAWLCIVWVLSPCLCAYDRTS